MNRFPPPNVNLDYSMLYVVSCSRQNQFRLRPPGRTKSTKLKNSFMNFVMQIICYVSHAEPVLNGTGLELDVNEGLKQQVKKTPGHESRRDRGKPADVTLKFQIEKNKQRH